MLRLGLAIMALVADVADARRIIIRNDMPRLAVDGTVVDAHDGMLLEHKGTYFLYGESYGNQTLATAYPWASRPRLLVYTSQDLMNWTCRGDPLPMESGTLWIPNVIYHAATARFIMWYGSGGWKSATSNDGIHFTPSKYGVFYSRFGAEARTDGTGLLVDDDGVGYVAFAVGFPGFDQLKWPVDPAPAHPGWPGHDAHNYGHIVTIERLSDDLLTSTKINVTGWFPDDLVESPSLFKRGSKYYLTYGSCCCGCQVGSGVVVFTASHIQGPWTRQPVHSDLNCRNASQPICGGGHMRSTAAKYVFDAQWWSASAITLGNGGTQRLLFGRRWLSGPHVPDGCHDICGNRGKPELCQRGGAKYLLKTDYSVWYPLEFEPATGALAPFREMPSFELELPDDDSTPPTLPPQLSVGAIRWDAYNGLSGDVISRTVAQTMAPRQFTWRLPWYAKVAPDPTNATRTIVSFNADQQSIMDDELKLASAAGLSYFAYDTYCVYPTDAALPQCAGWWGGSHPSSRGYKATDPAYGLHRHLSSPYRHLVNFTLLLLGASPATPYMRRRYLPLLVDRSYHRVLGGRPLVFLFLSVPNADDEAAKVGGWTAWRAQWQALRDESLAQGSGNPYLVAMDLSFANAQALKAKLGFDAVSAYALPQGGPALTRPFAAQVDAARDFWEAAAAAGEPVVPPVPTGWDPRPRAMHPPVWVNESAEHYERPKPSELTSLFVTACKWSVARPDAVPAQAAIAYAWNENTEGGWLLPTKGEGCTRLDAVAQALKNGSVLSSECVSSS